MSSDEIKKLLRAVPFQPFTVHLVSDKTFPIPHPDFALLTPTGRTLFVASAGSDAVDILDVPLIARVQIHEGSKAGS